MTPEQELAQANTLAYMYPITIQSAGGAIINGKQYYWDYTNQTMVLHVKAPRKKREKKQQEEIR